MNGNAAYFLLFLLIAREEKIICPAISQKSIGTLLHLQSFYS